MRRTPVLLTSLAASLLAATAACGGGGGGHGTANAVGGIAFNGGATVAIGASATLSDVALADLNGDGALDLAVTSQSSGGVSIALGQTLGGAGHFGAATTVSVPTGSLSAVVAADFDADGDLDLAVSSATTSQVFILQNNGSASFSLAATINLAGGASPTAMVAADLDGDGAIDLAIANGGTDTVSVALGVGDGTFSTPTNISLAAGFAATAIVAADFDQDGKLDLAVSSGTQGSVTVLLGDGAGGSSDSFTATVDFGEHITGLVAGDFNEDGKIDLATSESDQGDVYVLLGDGTGMVVVGGEFETAVGASGLVAADFNLDGHLDLAVGADTRVAVLAGAGDSTFAEVRLFPASGNAAVALAAGDLNCDGSVDLVNANAASGTVGVLIGADHSISLSFSGATTVALGASVPQDVLLVDVNADGNADLLSIDQGTGSLSVALGHGDGTFAAAASFSAGASVTGEGMATGDVNGDGNVDVAIALRGTGGTHDGVAILLGDGSGSFSLSTTIDIGLTANTTGVVLADLDGDGKLDVAATAARPLLLPSVAVALGTGGGSFSLAVHLDLTLGFSASGVVAADVNGDGRLDLVASSSLGGTVDVMLGTGGGSFSASVATTVAAGDDLSAIVAADLNCDGKVDLAVTDHTDGTVRILLGNGDGTFALGATVAATAGASALVAADLDNDGHVDLAVTGDGSSSVAVLLGNGDGTFAGAVSFATSASGSAAVSASDLNHDGKVDLSTANSLQSNASVLLNAGQ